MDKWQVPYSGCNTTRRDTFKKRGVYLVRNKETKKIVYIGMSRSNLYTAMYRHFQSWNDSKQRRVTFCDRSKYEIRVLFVHRDWVEYVECRLIRVFNPVENIRTYEEVEDIQDLRPDNILNIQPDDSDEEEVPF